MVKAASLVEHNARAYAHTLPRLRGRPRNSSTPHEWAEEEVQHGRRWPLGADGRSGFDFEAAFVGFRKGSRVDFEPTDRAAVRAPARWSRVASSRPALAPITPRCAGRLRTGAAADLPHVAADEFRHYRLFYSHLGRYLGEDGRGIGRLRSPSAASPSPRRTSSLTPITPPTRPTPSRRYCNRAYASRAYALYQPHHVERGVAMLLKTAGLTPNGRLGLLASRLAWRAMRHRVASLAKAAA